MTVMRFIYVCRNRMCRQPTVLLNSDANRQYCCDQKMFCHVVESGGVRGRHQHDHRIWVCLECAGPPVRGELTGSRHCDHEFFSTTRVGQHDA